VNGDVPLRRLNRANIGVTTGRWGSVGVAYVGILSAAEDVKLVSLSYSLRLFAGISAFVSAFHDLARTAGSGVFLSLSMPFGSRGSVSIGTNIQNGVPIATAQASQSANLVGDVGWVAAAQGGQGVQSEHAFGNVDYKSQYGLFGVGLDRFGRTTTARITADGAIAFADGRPFATNTIQDSFAVVDTDGTPGISVLDENRFVAKTGNSGRVLIPDLRSYELNRVSIDPNDVPADADVPVTMSLVRPQDRSAAIVRFPIRASRGALVVLVKPGGQPVPLGSQVTVQDSEETVVIGHGGEAFLRNLAAHNQLTVTEPSGARCSASFDYQSVPGDLPRIGPLNCQ
jgi:outer membrane usher protein